MVPHFPDIDVVTARALVDRRLEHTGGDGVWLDTDDIEVLAGCYGIALCPTRRVANADEAVAVAEEIGFPIALKAGSPDIVHKTDAGGVRLGLADAGEVRAAFVEMDARLGSEMGGALIQAMAPRGVETIVGVVHDESFGPIVMFGLGGTTAELLGDRSVRILPLTDVDAHDLVRSLRGSPLLFGYRGAPLLAVERVEEILSRVGLMADDLPEIAELDLNPVVVSEDGAVARRRQAPPRARPHIPAPRPPPHARHPPRVAAVHDNGERPDDACPHAAQA